MLRVAMGFLHANATEMVTEEQARCLQALEQVDSMSTATRASVLRSFISGRGYCADADYSPRSWLIHRTRITKGAATAHTAWVRRAAAHPWCRRRPSGRGHVLSESLRTDDLRLDRQATRGLPGRRRRDPARRRDGRARISRTWLSWPGDLRPVPPRRQRSRRRLRGSAGPGRDHTCGTCHRGHLGPEPFVIPPGDGPRGPQPVGVNPPRPK